MGHSPPTLPCTVTCATSSIPTLHCPRTHSSSNPAQVTPPVRPSYALSPSVGLKARQRCPSETLSFTLNGQGRLRGFLSISQVLSVQPIPPLDRPILQL